MSKRDHLRLRVSDQAQSGNAILRLKVESEAKAGRSAALNDSEDLAVFLQQALAPITRNDFAPWCEVADADAGCAERSRRGIRFAHEPRGSYWGYGAGIVDADGCLIRLWDKVSMREK